MAPKITNSSTPVRTNRNGETIVCNQYIGQGVETSEAIKKLDEKLDQLIKLLQPPAFPGKMHSIIAPNFHDFISESLHFLALYVIPVNLKVKQPWRLRQQKSWSARASHFLVSFYRNPLLQGKKEKKQWVQFHKGARNFKTKISNGSRDFGCQSFLRCRLSFEAMYVFFTHFSSFIWSSLVQQLVQNGHMTLLATWSVVMWPSTVAIWTKTTMLMLSTETTI